MRIFKKPSEQRMRTRKKILSVAIGSTITLLLTGCGGGTESTSESGMTSGHSAGTSISGAGINSPLINATVQAYKINLTTGDVATTPIATGTTGEQAKIQGLSLPFPISPPYLLKFTVNPGTTVPGGGTPDLKELYTLIMSADEAVYATAISSMAVLMANGSYKSFVTIPANESKGSSALYESFVKRATNTVKDTLGFGLLNDDFNIFTTSPMINSDGATPLQVSNAVLYRTAANAAVKTVVKLAGASASDQTTNVIESLALDLQDGAIDGVDAEGAGIVYRTINPNGENEVLPYTGVTSRILQVLDDAEQTQDIVALLNQEKSTTGGGSAVVDNQEAQEFVLKLVADIDDDGIPDNIDKDLDDDGFNDAQDAFPLDKAEWLDTDSDNLGNNQDTDDDGDGIIDTQDDFPLDVSRSSAEDLDNDGWPAGQDADDNDANNPGTAFFDTDGDGVGDTTDPDIDGDGVDNSTDLFDYNPTEWSDLDGDGVNNNLATDGNGSGDNSDPDIDGDKVLNDEDFDSYDPSLLARSVEDIDGDGFQNNVDPDMDGDGLLNDIDGVDGASKTNPDRDSDGTKDGRDNCVNSANPDQLDANTNGIGALCEAVPTVTELNLIATVGENIPVTLVGADGDQGADLLIYAIETQPNTGNLRGTGANRIYLANPGSNGDDSFTYTVSDGEHDSAMATVNLAINNNPTLSATPVETAIVGALYSFQVAAADADADDINYSLEGAPSWLSINATGLVSGAPLIDAEGMTGEIVVKVEDGRGGEAALAAFVVTVFASSNGTLMIWNTNNWNSANWQ